ncbi:hypothetical protein [Streptomyces ziwulingensis]|uniref:ATP/GTP-binding protein n=1 Tax=Streptomyces ziwulingensis TaxID=1045501 RepID=A0ABP9C215_9ACTN
MSTAEPAQPEDTSHPNTAVDRSGPARALDRLTGGPVAGPARRRWTRRLAVGLVVGALAWSVAALLRPEAAVWRQFLAALLCAAATVLIQHLIDLDRRLEQRSQDAHRTLAETVRESLRRHEEEPAATRPPAAGEPPRAAEGSLAPTERETGAPRLPDRADEDGVPDLAGSFAEVLAPGPAILGTFVRMEMKRVVGHLTDLTNLTAECPGENHDWMLTLTYAAQHSICATSTSVDREFWNSEPASRYLQAQREVIADRGIPVRRLFLLPSARELDDKLLRLCDEQESLNIDVRVAVLPELPPHLQRGTTNDFIVYDEEVTFEIEQDLRDVNVRTRLNARQPHIQDCMKRFRELWEGGMSVRELEVRVDDEEEGTWMVDQG